jgi:2-(1,2-epoxy-1,2-dihydrophenyl)acetyl-CoA isomerase
LLGFGRNHKGESMSETFIHTECTGSICSITLSRADKMNSICRELAEELLVALNGADTNSAVRVIVLRAEGKAFCAGQDLREAMEMRSAQKIVEEVYNPLVKQIMNSSTPVVAAVQGMAVGAGANLALICDFVLAADTAVFSQAFSKIGLVPDTGGSFLLPRLIGLARARQLCMLGDAISAQQAFDLGLVYSVHPPSELDAAVIALAERLANGPTLAFGLTKKMLLQSFDNDLAAQLQLEGEFQEIASQSLDFKEGLTSFLEKRSPQFLGK